MDWRDTTRLRSGKSAVITKVRDISQPYNGIEQCASSFAVATVEAVEAFRAIKTDGKILRELSVSQLINGVHDGIGFGMGAMICQGSTIEHSLDYVMYNAIQEAKAEESKTKVNKDNSYQIDEW